MAVVRAGLHGTVAQSSAQVIDGSLLFQKTSIITPLAPDYALTWEPSYAASLQKNTISGWFQRSNIGGTQTLFSTCQDSTNNDYFEISLANDQLKVYNRSDSQNSGNAVNVVTHYKIRDFISWYHFVVVLDSTQATESDRVKIYINGIRQVVSASPTYPDLNYNFHFPSSTATSPSWDIGRSVWGGGSAGSGQYFGGYASQFYFIDGQALDESYFGYTDPLTNTWRPKKFSGSYSINTDGYKVRWSDYLTTNDTLQNAGYAFDGDTSTRAQTVLSGSNRTITFSPPDINFTTSLEVYCDQGATGPAPMPTASWDGNSVEPGQGAWVTVYSGSGTLGSAKPLVIDTNSASQYATLKGVRIDGTVLVDVDGLNSFYLPFDGNLPIVEDQSGNGNDFTQFNFGSSNVIPKATGALPILNTVNGGKVATAGVRTDAFGNNCVLALPMVGIKSDFSNQINSGSTEKEMNTGNPVTIANSQKDNFYGGSFIFDGTTGGGGSDYLYANSNSDFDFGGGDYTIEWWSFWSAAPGQGFHQSIFDCGYTQADSLLIQSEGNDSTKWIVYAQGDTVLTETTPSPLQRWTHYALVRNGTSMKLYRNGSVSGSGTHTGTTHGSSNYAFSIGYEPTNNGRVFNGYIQDFRIYKGVAKYTDNFIPASVNPTILPNTSSGVSLGSQLTKIIDGAVGFDDPNYPTFLTFSPSSNFDFGTGNFTIEGFFNKNTANATLTLLCSENYHTSGYNGNWILRITDNTQIAFASYDGQGNGEYVEFPCENVPGVWYHFAFVREGIGTNESKFYLNGKLCGSMTVSKSLTDAGTYGLRIGYESAGGPGNGTYHGFLSNIRIIKGTAFYTADFIPPTEPLTNVTNTKLLCCQSNTSVTDAAVGGSVTPWIPSGFTYWTDGMSANWNGSGNTTSGSNDYISIALPQSGKYYWETIINDPGTYRILGISSGAAGAGTGYTDDIFGYYYNNPIPLYLTRNAGGTTRGSGDNGGAGIATHGNYNPFQWEAGKKLMWALDADNDKIWFGYEGSWVQSADPANGTNPTILGEDLSAYDFHFKLGYNNGGGNLTLTNVASGDAGSTTDPTVNGVGLSATNFNPFADDINTVMGQETSYCTWDPIARNSDWPTYTISNGNLDFTTTGSPNLSGYGSVGVTSGKWYWEVVHTVFANADFDAATYVSFSFPYRTPRDKGIGYMTDGRKRINDSISGYGTSYAVGDVIGIALDADQNTVTYYKDGKSQGPIEFVSSGSTNFSVSRPQDFTSFRPSIHQVNGSYNLTGSGNFGQKPFKYTPPEGHQPLNYANLQSPEVVRPDQYVGVTTYPGTGTTPYIISGYQFSPDLVWVKQRNGTTSNILFDTVRGVQESIHSDTLDKQVTAPTSLLSFNGDGFTVGIDSDLNQSASFDYVGWCWKAGGNKNTFNVDDLGYANASDVNMGISDLNSTYYNQDQDWSGTLGSDAAFDNDFSSVGVPVGTTYVDLTDKPFSVSSIISVWIHDPGANNPVYIKYNGVEYSNTNPTIYGWTDFTVPAGTNNAGNSGALQVKLHASNDNCRGVKVDGRILVDNTITITLPSIAPTGCSVGTKQGFSIVSWTGNATEGATLAHGLKKAPSFVIVKNLDDNNTVGQPDEGRWMVWHQFYSGKQYLTLETDDNLMIENGASTPWGNTIPASSYITLGSYNATNGSTDKMISYMWHDVPGLQKFGFYRGSGTTDGPFIELGFSPAILLIKGITTQSAWALYDNVRDPGNPSFRWLRANDYQVENTDATADNIDLLSNGFKLRNDGASAPHQSWTNKNADYYIYAAWAYQPMNNLYGGQSNAR